MGELIGSGIILLGSVFLFSAGLGVLRMPDAYNRIQTGTKATTLGTIMILVGIAFLALDLKDWLVDLAVVDLGLAEVGVDGQSVGRPDVAAKLVYKLGVDVGVGRPFVHPGDEEPTMAVRRWRSGLTGKRRKTRSNSCATARSSV